MPERRSIFARPAGPRAKWLVFWVWVVAIFIAAGPANLPAKFTDAEENESTSFLPGDAESTKALEAVERLQGAETAAAVVVYRREGGLTPADRERIAADRETFNADLPRATAPLSEPVPSEDGTAVLLTSVITGDGEGDTIIDPVEELREQVSDPGGGLEAKVTGPAGYAADAIKVFENINGTLLLSASLLVFVLLILIYRSPIFWVIPIIAVAFAEIATRGVVYGLTQFDITINTQTSSILSVLVLGAGTDYALLLVSRYREELRKHEDKHEALALALRTAGPAIVASGSTVIFALLCLSFAEVNATSGLGPIGAGGIAVAMLSMLTLLPALLVITGRWAFWRQVGERVARHPRRVWVTTAVLLAICAAGVLNLEEGLTQSNGFREKVEAIEGQELLAKSFPSGGSAPTEIIVPDESRVPAVQEAVAQTKGVAD